MVGQEVPATGSSGVVVACATGVDVVVVVEHVQSTSVRHCGFLQLPVVCPDGM